MTDRIEALHAIFRDHHDVVDVGDGDRPGQGPNWAMKCTALLEEIEGLIPRSERGSLFNPVVAESADAGSRLQPQQNQADTVSIREEK